MSQVERGGQNVLRWPAELPETDNPEGSVGEEARDREEQSERLAALPEHEQDPDEAVGGGMLASGGTAVEHGSAGDRSLGSDEGAPGGESGVPMGDTPER